MNDQIHFNAGTAADVVPKSDAARQAVDALRGYVYQALAAALAWLEIDENEKLFLEVAEDYAVMAKSALGAVQVKDTRQSGSITLNSPSVRNAVAAFIDLVERNPSVQVNLRFLTTSEIGTEKFTADRLGGLAGLIYWEKVAAGADLSPLRAILENKFPESVKYFCRSRDDASLRRDLIQRIYWHCGTPDFSTLRKELELRLIDVGHNCFNLPAPEARQLVDSLVYQVLEKSIVKSAHDRVLTRADLYAAIDAATLISIPRHHLHKFMQLAPGLEGIFSENVGTDRAPSFTDSGWLIDGTSLPSPQGMVPRNAVESTIANTLKISTVGILVGSSGLGKSIVCRSVSTAQDENFFLADFRNADASEICVRLDVIFGRIGSLNFSTLVLEDLNQLDDSGVALSLARVVDALRRRFRKALITCYKRPAVKTLTEIGLEHH